MNPQQLTEVPLAHYKDIYAGLNPQDIVARTGVAFADGAFTFTLLGQKVSAAWPAFTFCALDGAVKTFSPKEQILALRFLCDGKPVAHTGHFVSYNEIPSAQIYIRNYKARVLDRLAGTFGSRIDAFKKAVLGCAALRPVELSEGDFGVAIDFMDGSDQARFPLRVQIMLWEKDEDFPAQSQLLFADNMAAGFSAEDLVVCGETVCSRLGKLL
jgi:hypothetical protein